MNHKHLGSPEVCPACEESVRPPCHYCGHCLTGKFDEHGVTVCENCGKRNDLGIGNKPD